MLFVVRRLQELGRARRIPLHVHGALSMSREHIWLSRPRAAVDSARTLRRTSEDVDRSLSASSTKACELAYVRMTVSILNGLTVGCTELSLTEYGKGGCVLKPHIFNVLFAAAIHAVVERFIEDPDILRDLVHLEEDLGEDGMKVTTGMCTEISPGYAVRRRCRHCVEDDARSCDRFRSSRSHGIRRENRDIATAETQPTGTPGLTARCRSSGPEAYADDAVFVPG